MHQVSFLKGPGLAVFSTDVGSNGYDLALSDNGYSLKKGEVFLYEQKRDLTTLYKKLKVDIKGHSWLSDYPLSVVIANSRNITICKPKWHWRSNSTSWLIELDGVEVGIFERSGSIFSKRMVYSMQMEDKIVQEEVELLMFILIYMFVRLNDNSGT